MHHDVPIDLDRFAHLSDMEDRKPVDTEPVDRLRFLLMSHDAEVKHEGRVYEIQTSGLYVPSVLEDPDPKWFDGKLFYLSTNGESFPETGGIYGPPPPPPPVDGLIAKPGVTTITGPDGRKFKLLDMEECSLWTTLDFETKNTPANSILTRLYGVRSRGVQ